MRRQQSDSAPESFLVASLSLIQFQGVFLRMVYTVQEQENIDLLKGFFERFRTATTDPYQSSELDEYINTIFADDARFIIRRGGSEIYDGLDEQGNEVFRLTAGEPTPPEFITDTNAYSDERRAHEVAALVPEAIAYMGADGVKTFLAALDEDFDFENRFTEFNDLKYISDGNQVAVYGYLRYVHARTGNFVSTPFAINVDFDDDGKIELYHYLDNSAAYAAASREGGHWWGQYGFIWAENDSPLPALHPVYIQWGTRNDDSLEGDQDAEQLRDQLFGYQGDDFLQGGKGDDYLNGGSGNDWLEGGSGSDILWGYSGFDEARGGDGPDFFVLASDADITGPGDEGYVTIADFDPDEDKLVGAPGLVDSTDGETVTNFSVDITFDQLAITQNGADTEIRLAATDELLAVVTSTDASVLTRDRFIDPGVATESTVLEKFPAFRGYPDDAVEEDVFTEAAEAKYRDIVLGFFFSFANGQIFQYIADNFQDEPFAPSVYNIIEEQNSYFEIYNPDIADYSVSFAHERFLYTPPTQGWRGIPGAQAFIASLGDANDLSDPVTKFYLDDLIQNGPDIGLFGRFEYRDRRTEVLHETPIGYHFRINPENDKVEFIHFFEDAFSYSNASRQGGTWRANLSPDELVDFTFGTGQGETLLGSQASDRIYGYGGSDTIRLRGGDDTAFGGESHDVIKGGAGNDVLYGNAGNDVVAGEQGDDTIFGGPGDDILRGDLNRRESKRDRGGDDYIEGGEGRDRISGKAGDDILLGGDDNDRIWGNGGNDILQGGPGNDRLTGDDRSGDRGRDLFVLAVGEGTDVITDFQVGEDQIALLGAITFDHLTISQGTGKQAHDTLIEVTDSGEVLAILARQTASDIGANSFVDTFELPDPIG
jgi:Ca2+-binding RTX toxin-like protein